MGVGSPSRGASARKAPAKRRAAAIKQAWSEDDLKSALQSVRDGSDTKAAARAWGVPASTLGRYVSGKQQVGATPGAPTALTKEDEQLLAQRIKDMVAERGTVPVDVIRAAAAEREALAAARAGRRPRWPGGVAGKHWWARFKARHQLRLRGGQAVEADRRAAGPPEVVRGDDGSPEAEASSDGEGGTAAAAAPGAAPVPQLPQLKKKRGTRIVVARFMTGPEFVAAQHAAEEAAAAAALEKQRQRDAKQQERERKAAEKAAEKKRRAAGKERAAAAKRSAAALTKGMSRAQLVALVTQLQEQRQGSGVAAAVAAAAAGKGAAAAAGAGAGAAAASGGVGEGAGPSGELHGATGAIAPPVTAAAAVTAGTRRQPLRAVQALGGRGGAGQRVPGAAGAGSAASKG